MSRDLTRRRHGRHRSFERVRRSDDTLGFLDEQQARLDALVGEIGIFDSMHLVQGDDRAFTHEQVQEAAGSSDLDLFGAQSQSMDFDGGTEALLNLTPQPIGIANAWSFSIWSKVANNTGAQVIAAIGTAGFDEIEIRKDPGGKLFVLWVGNDGTSGFAEWLNFYNAVGVWQHTLITWNGTILRVYDDGVDVGVPDVGSATPTLTMVDTSRAVGIGNDAGAPVFAYDGRLAQVALWRAAVDSAAVDIYAVGNPNFLDLNEGFGGYTFAGDLAHWWRPGHEPSPNLGKDYSRAGFTPTIDLSVDSQGITDVDRIVDVPPPFVAQTRSLDFDGNLEDLRNSDALSIGITNTWTLSLWLRSDFASDSQGIFAIGGGQPNTIEVSKPAAATSLLVTWTDASGSPSGSAQWNGFIDVLDWHHALLTWDGTTLRAYSNGVDQGAPDVGSATPTLTMAASNRPMVLGNTPTGNQGWNGRISQVAMWRVAADSAVADIYNGGSGSTVDLNRSFGGYVFAGDLAHWWRPGEEASPNLGKDYSLAGFTPTIDIEQDATGVTDANRSSDVP